MIFTRFQCPRCKKMNQGYLTDNLLCVSCGYIWKNPQQKINNVNFYKYKIKLDNPPLTQKEKDDMTKELDELHDMSVILS